MSLLHKITSYTLTNYKVKVRCFWKTRKVRSLFVLKDKANVIHKANVIYKGTCSCNEFYVGDTKRNSEVRWREHFSAKKTYVYEHLFLNPGHTVN